MSKAMIRKTLIVCLYLAITSSLPGSEASVTSIMKAGWKKLWQFSCAYSSVLPRSKRSLLVEIPSNLSDANSMFAYLYPSANKTRETLQLDASGRSLGEDRSFTSWVDHMVQVWQSECIRQQRPEARDDEEAPATPETPDAPNSSDFLSVGNVTTSENPAEPGLTSATNETFTAFKEGTYTLREPGPNPASSISDPEKYFNSTIHENRTPAGNNTGAKDERTGAIAQAIQASQPPLKQKNVNAFFSVYGGDIEYFYPLISFGIPFDGEITLIGFHGFKGLFPYK